MAIGDEKVVAEVYVREWYDDSVGCNSMRTELALTWKGKPADRPPAGTKLIPQSAYAELAAEGDAIEEIWARKCDEIDAHRIAAESQLAELAADRDRWKSASLAQSGYAYTAEARADKAESQLAELRGRLEERCVMLDGLAGVIRQYGLCAPMALEEVAKQIRALAAADGGADGH